MLNWILCNCFQSLLVCSIPWVGVGGVTICPGILSSCNKHSDTPCDSVVSQGHHAPAYLGAGEGSVRASSPAEQEEDEEEGEENIDHDDEGEYRI